MGSGIRYEVEVKFHRDFLEVHGNRIIVGLTSKPERGRANRELIRKLAKHFNLPQSHVRIVSGLRSRKKVIKIVEE